MLDWLSKKRREEKRKQAEEDKLRASLSEKLARYEESQQTAPSNASDADHTELMVDGKKLRIPKTQIDMADA